MRKIKPNEIIGFGAGALGMFTVVSYFLGKIGEKGIILAFVFLLIQIIFLSFWGLETFNPWVYRKLKKKKHD